MILNAVAASRNGEAATGLVCSCSLPAVERASWAWLADTHVSGDAGAQRNGWRPAQQVARVVEEIAATQPDGVLVNGDLAWLDGAPDDYVQFQALLRPVRTLPLVLGVGNHDCRENLLAHFGCERDSPVGWLASVVEQPPNRFVMLDSQIAPGVVGGEIGGDQLGWLGSLLADAPRRRTIVFVHHPGESSSEGCRDFNALARLAQSCPHVQAIVTGHDHEFSLGRVGEVHLIGLPSAGFPFDSGADCGWVEAGLSADGLRLRYRGTISASGHHLDWRSLRP